MSRLGVLQVDSVNVLVRSHYLPAFSRIGPYPRKQLDELAYKKRRLFEYWGHQASLLPVELHPLFRWRMNSDPHHRYLAWAKTNDKLLKVVMAQVNDRGPISASELTDTKRGGGGPWWDWGEGKAALEYLFVTGRVTTSARRNFERLYDLPERVIPQDVLSTPTPSDDDARRALIEFSAKALGVATVSDLANYFQMSKTMVRDLVQDCALQSVRVEGWTQPAFMPNKTKLAPRFEGSALLSPFDSLVWERPRTERLFGMHYRIEIYVPAPKRIFGYYVLPYLLGEELVARVDLKADRKASALLVKGAFPEDGQKPAAIASALRIDLERMAEWLELDRIDTSSTRGDVGDKLRSVRRTSRST
ncbi:MAG: crosslink repair DNA glycosylase YcaQ family protein [Actinomycetota bacterium]